LEGSLTQTKTGGETNPEKKRTHTCTVEKEKARNKTSPFGVTRERLGESREKGRKTSEVKGRGQWGARKRSGGAGEFGIRPSWSREGETELRSRQQNVVGRRPRTWMEKRQQAQLREDRKGSY